LSEQAGRRQAVAMEGLYGEADRWRVNTGGQTIHAKRLPGKWRRIKWLTASVWLVYFAGPYLRWEGRQAVLFDIPDRQYHLFGATVLPQDFWMLSLLLLFFAILLAVTTAVAGRVWCGFFCFQTVWTDVFTWLEERLEGPPGERRRLDQAPLGVRKLSIRAVKHGLWLAIGLLTGFSFVAWFTDVFGLWQTFFVGQAPLAAYVTVALFAAGTYVLAGFLREQTCFWLCPYARIQGVMLDRSTVVPAYDYRRGEPRGRLHRGATSAQGDCVDCHQCVAVCPTGVDIRDGQQEGCITCGLCIDACDAVMEKVGRPSGLVRYASLDELEGRPATALLRRARVWVYAAILLVAAGGIGYGFASLEAVELKVLHERAPLFVRLADGSIQNKYTLKVLNKTSEDLRLHLSARGPLGLELATLTQAIKAPRGEVTPVTLFVRVPVQNLDEEQVPIQFQVQGRRADGEAIGAQRASVFIGPGAD